jgi:orotate phosphoribosyltransferase
LREHAFEEREVTLSSGQKSNFYIDCKRVSLRGEGLFLIGQLFASAIMQLAPGTRAVGGMTLGADPLASATAMAGFIGGRNIDAFIVRKEPKGHGTGQWIEGADHLQAGTRVAVLEDVITSGATTLRAIERVRASELEVLHVFALVDRLEGGREAIERAAPLTALFSRRDFMP